MVDFKFDKDHGNNKKGKTVKMVLSTAEALQAHKIGKILKAEKESKE